MSIPLEKYLEIGSSVVDLPFVPASQLISLHGKSVMKGTIELEPGKPVNMVFVVMSTEIGAYQAGDDKADVGIPATRMNLVIFEEQPGGLWNKELKNATV